jgi:serine-type D-Ala-D-Ala carboxypeptidase/endopeptidase (penicillin-binding protein 4)
MKRIYLLTLCIVFGITAAAQTLKAKLDAAVKQLENDAQLKHGLIGFSVIDASTGKTVYERSGEVGLAPASTQKIFTSIAAFELLGKDYRYKTSFGIDGIVQDSSLKGPLFIIPSGDPSLGSWRFQSTSSSTIINSIISALKARGIKNWSGGIYYVDNKFESNAIPNGWIWEDIGNYYGAGHYDFNWNENQYDLVLDPGKKAGDSVIMLLTRPKVKMVFKNELKTGPRGSGDNAFIYFDPIYERLHVRGTVPCCVDSFVISGSFNGIHLFILDVESYMRGNRLASSNFFLPHLKDAKITPSFIPLLDYYSPGLDSLNFYFLKRSINLYGEALVRTIAREKANLGSTEKGLELIRDFFESKGIEKSALDIIDGSGLSPQNRVTTNALTKALRYAKSRPWFSSFYYALPEINGMKMKSGLIGGVRSYAGYQKAANGKEYIFAIIVNNYDGSSSEINKKMFKILDYLK